MNPEEQHLEHMATHRANCIKGSHAMARASIQIIHPKPLTVFNFKVYIRIWQDDDFIYGEWVEYCEKLIKERLDINTNSYKAMADQLYDLIATEMPGREIKIQINSAGKTGLSIKYDFKT